MRPRPEDGHVPRFQPWVGGTPTPIVDEPPPPAVTAVDDDLDETESVDTSVQGDSEDTETLPEVEADVLPPRAPQLRAAFEAMDQVNVVGIFHHRAAVMKTVPRFLQGPFRNVMKVVLEEVMASDDPTRKERGWKVFLMLPRMLLHRPPGGGHVSRNKLSSRFEAFNRGEWTSLIEASIACDAQAAQSRCRQRRRAADVVEQRAIRAETLVQVGELSHARQVLEGADLAPGNQATLDALSDQSRRPALPREPLPEELTNFTPARAFELDESKFNKNLRSSRRGAAAGPSGMTMEHLRPLLDNDRALHTFFSVAEQFARAQVPQGVVDMVRLGRLTALSKPDGGVRGIVAGDVVRRLVARTMSQQLSPAVERATRPHQYAMTTKAGCECIAHALQGLTEIDPEATITSIDGVGAFDLISRRAMLEGLRQVSSEAVPFARMFYGQASEYLWESDSGEIHSIPREKAESREMR